MAASTPFTPSLRSPGRCLGTFHLVLMHRAEAPPTATLHAADTSFTDPLCFVRRPVHVAAEEVAWHIGRHNSRPDGETSAAARGMPASVRPAMSHLAVVAVPETPTAAAVASSPASTARKGSTLHYTNCNGGKQEIIAVPGSPPKTTRINVSQEFYPLW
jgi:hypothetical protein